jgi:ubiquinone/menaquinone biosynthesis C-methylase UbiE
MDSNQKTYTSAGIVDYYTQLTNLQPAEQTIINLLKDQLPSFKMLDLGIGGGRTTRYFAPLVAQYVGIDYSPAMITACKQRFLSFPQTVSLEVGDARNLSKFENNYFDFILFSFNGIDYSEHPERIQILKEIRRVGKPGGYFYFSTHNLDAIKPKFSWQKQLSFNPFASYVNLLMCLILKAANRGITTRELSNADYLIIRDEPHNFRLKNYYIKPLPQLKQLEPDFREIKVYSWQTGKEITNTQELIYHSDLWLYYLCKII